MTDTCRFEPVTCSLPHRVLGNQPTFSPSQRPVSVTLFLTAKQSNWSKSLLSSVCSCSWRSVGEAADSVWPASVTTVGSVLSASTRRSLEVPRWRDRGVCSDGVLSWWVFGSGSVSLGLTCCWAWGQFLFSPQKTNKVSMQAGKETIMATAQPQRDHLRKEDVGEEKQVSVSFLQVNIVKWFVTLGGKKKYICKHSHIKSPGHPEKTAIVDDRRIFSMAEGKHTSRNMKSALKQGHRSLSKPCGRIITGCTPLTSSKKGNYFLGTTFSKKWKAADQVLVLCS